jgi:cytochrome b561
MSVAGLKGVKGSTLLPDSSPFQRYDRLSSTLHWLVALLVFVMLGLGFYMVEVPRQTPLRGALFNLHKSIGLLVLGLMILRTFWRMAHRPPPLSGLSAFNMRTAIAVHLLLYLLLLAQPVAGYVASSLGSYGVAFFGIELPRWAPPNPELREIFLAIHRLVARLIVLLLLLHIAGTLLHVLHGRRDIVRRMSPWEK